jgi:hypothetical protein
MDGELDSFNVLSKKTISIKEAAFGFRLDFYLKHWMH